MINLGVKYLFRNLNWRQDPTEDISPGNPDAEVDFYNFLHNGSKMTKMLHQFLAFTKSMNVICRNTFNKKKESVAEYGMIVVDADILTSYVPESHILDVSCPEAIEETKLKKPFGDKSETWYEMCFRYSAYSEEVDIEKYPIYRKCFFYVTKEEKEFKMKFFLSNRPQDGYPEDRIPLLQFFILKDHEIGEEISYNKMDNETRTYNSKISQMDSLLTFLKKEKIVRNVDNVSFMDVIIKTRERLSDRWNKENYCGTLEEFEEKTLGSKYSSYKEFLNYVNMALQVKNRLR